MLWLPYVPRRIYRAPEIGIPAPRGERVEITTRRQIHPRLLFTSDVYVLPPSVTLRRLDSLGVRRSRFREARWEGRRVYVVGAAAGDTLSSPFWVDADGLLLVRWPCTASAGRCSRSFTRTCA